MASRSAQRQQELDALEAMIANMEGDENEVFDPKAQKMQLDPDLVSIQKQANQFLSQHGEKPVNTQQKSYKPKVSNEQEYQNALQGENTSAQQRMKNISALENMIGDISSDEDTSGPIAQNQKFAMDPETAALMKQCQQMSSQYGIDMPEPEKILAKPAAEVKPPPSGNQIIDQDNYYTNIMKITSIDALLGEKEFYEKRFLNNKNPQMQQHGQTQIKNITNFLNILAKKYAEQSLNAEKYREIVKKAYLSQQELFKEANAEGNKLYKGRLMQRCGLIQGEYKACNNDEEGHFQKIVQKLPQNTSKPANFVYEIDTKDQKEKIQALAERNIHYLNLYSYFKKQGARLNEVQGVWFPLLGKFKQHMTQLKEGEDEKIGKFLEEEAPKITPQVFHNMTEQTYKAKIKQYHQLFNNCFELELNFKKMIQNNKSAIKQAEESADRIKQYQLDMYELEEMQDFSKMVYFPEIEEKVEQRNIRTSNLQIEKYTVKIVFKRLLGAKPDKYQLQWSLDINNGIFSDATSWCDKSLVFGYEKQLTTGDRKNPYNNLHKKKISISMYSKGIFSNSAAGNGILDLSELETNANYEGMVNIQHKTKVYQLEFGVYIREPIASSEFAGGKSKCVRIVKRYEKFNVGDGVQKYVDKCLGEAKPPKKKEEPKPQPPKPQPQPPKPQQAQVQKQKMETEQVQIQPQQKMNIEEEQEKGVSLPVLEHEDSHPDIQLLKGITNIPKGLTSDIIVNPENPTMCHCLTYLKCYQKDVEEAAIRFGTEKKRGERRIARDLNDRLMSMQIKLEKAMKDGDIEMGDYLEGLQELLDRDNGLICLYQQLPQLKQDWVGFVQKRKSIIEGELNQGKYQTQQQEEPQQKQQQQKMEIEEQKSQEQPGIPSLIVLEHEPGHPDMQYLAAVNPQELERGLNIQMIQNPENPIDNNCFLYVQQFQKDLEAATIRFGQEKKRGERKLARNLNDQCMTVQLKLKKGMDEGDIEQEDYIDNLKEMIERDEKLIKFYETRARYLQQDWAGFVKSRKKIIELELSNMPQE